VSHSSAGAQTNQTDVINPHARIRASLYALIEMHAHLRGCF